MNKDSRGIAMTGADAYAVGRYERALEQFKAMSATQSPPSTRLLQASPAFVAGHL
jgi:hypothetical protein